MDDPHLRFDTVHIGGTNGKTTVTWLVENLLAAHDCRTGSYTSPHLEQLQDRYRLGGKTIAPEVFTSLVSRTSKQITAWEKDNADQLTYFETTVALAMRLFKDSNVDIAVIEVGLGGRLDATNVLESKTAVITGVTHDHIDLLGGSLAAIAEEKAGIVHPGCRLVTGKLPEEAIPSIARRVAETGADWLRASVDYGVRFAQVRAEGWTVSIDGIRARYQDLTLPLRGRHQVEHLATAVAACEVSLGHPLDSESTQRALATLSIPGRIEALSTAPVIVADGAHNAEGLTGLGRALGEEFPQEHRILVVGFTGSRDPGSLLSPLAGLFSAVIVTQPEGGIPAETVAAAARTVFAETAVEVAVPPSEALETATRLAGSDGMVVVTGSLYLVGELRAIISDAAEGHTDSSPD